MRVEDLHCPFHHGEPRLISDHLVYGQSYGGKMWVCECFPSCEFRVGCHRGSDTPMGQMCDNATRQARQAAHQVFDQLWTQGWLKRNQAYDLLKRRMGSEKNVHIAESDIGECTRIAQIATGELYRLRTTLGKPSYETRETFDNE